MRRIAILALVAAAAAVASVRAEDPAPVRIGVFDAQRLSEESVEGKRIQGKLTAFRDAKQAELSAKERAIQEIQEKLQAQSLSLSPEKRTELEKEIQKKALDLNQAREAAQREILRTVLSLEQSGQLFISGRGREENRIFY